MELLPSALAPLSDRDVIAAVGRLGRHERTATADLVAALAELDVRWLYLGEGFPSLFAYCTGHLRFSKHEAYHRIEAARAGRDFPVIVDWLRDASLSLTAVSLLRPHLTADNHRALLEAARHQPTRAVEELRARVAQARHEDAGAAAAGPASRERPGPCYGRRVGVRRSEARYGGRCGGSPPGEPRRAANSRASTSPRRGAANRTRSLPLADDDLRRDAREAPAGAGPAAPCRADGGSGRGRGPRHTMLLEHLERTRCAATRREPKATKKLNPKPAAADRSDAHDRPEGHDVLAESRGGVAEARGRRAVTAGHGSGPTQPSHSSRHIPAAVRREVWARDQGQCAFVGAAGRCPERGFLELHHKDPFARGGPATAANLELRCRAHNRLEAERAFGGHFMGERISGDRNKQVEAAQGSTRCAPSLYDSERAP